MKKIITLSILLLSFIGGYGFAEGEKTKPDTEDEISKVNLASLSSDDIQSKSAEHVDTMRETLVATQDLLQKARDEKEGILTLNCINQQLAAMKGFVKISEQQAAIISKDKDRKVQENSFRLIYISADRVQVLNEDAQNCTGEASRFTDKKDIQRLVDPEIADINVVEIDDDRFDDGFAKEREPELTPYQ